MTNLAYIQSMPVEELADWLADATCDECKARTYCVTNRNSKTSCREVILSWLREERRMTNQEAAAQLKDLMKDRESLLSEDSSMEGIILRDIAALKIAIDVLERC